MNVEAQIEAYITSLSEPKCSEIQTLHQFILGILPATELWFLDGKDETGKTVSNPNIGYGLQTITYANGTTKPFYQIGISGNTGGISVYIMGIGDKQYLIRAYGDKIGKAVVSG
ncbi:MAG: DUF1801 domain-containing protein, partial [Saprospiraceae bacterium]|nr:DUF1801 domain-containing protein [Saprospiraceae bacterium]